MRTPPGLVNAITAPPSVSALVAASWASADDIAQRALAGIVGRARQRCRDRPRAAVGDRCGKLVVSLQQGGLFRIAGIVAGANDDVVSPGTDDVACRRVELQIDRGDDSAVLVATGDQPSVDVADIGLMGVAADHDVDRLVEFLDDVDDRSGDSGTFIIIAGRKTAFMDQHDDGFDAARLQLRHQRVHRISLVAEFEACDAHRRDDVGRVLQRQADEGDGNALELPDLVRRKYGPAGALFDGAGGKIVKSCAEERVRALTFVGGMTAAVLHPKQFVLALVEFVIADRGDLKPHHRQRFDGGLIVKHRRQKRAGADQVSGCDKDSVPGSPAELLDQRRHVLGAAGRHGEFSGAVVGIGDPDPARRRPKIAVEVVDRENPQIDRSRFG